ncbi:MAG: bifunctional 3-phosphoshikimate 1-carboxyvinyltransferase/cytidylate kinase [Zoogloeaceae bacterium]|nr:bifunctional 3-phosphoshikimate 1-carboxyvinyltransferase/cytidylate kinase [Zoogloeaceae bacterium]
MEFLDLPPLLGANGTVRLPGSKSISNRILLLAALADGVTDIRDLLESDDVARMLEALASLGIRWVRQEGRDDYQVQGVGGGFPVKAADLFLGNAGTAFRPLTAALAFSGGDYRLSGVPRMHERPIGDLVDALRQLGAQVTYLGESGYPPLHVMPGTLTPGGVVRVRGDVSSQFLTALLMALPLAGVETTVEVVGELISKPYIGITLDLMARFGVQVRREGWRRFTVPGGARYRSPGTIFVEGDASSASYFLAAGAIGGGPVRVEGVGRNSIQGDVRFAEALEALGVRIEMGDNWIEARGPVQGKLKAFDLDLNHIPDAAMTLAVAALFADGPCRLRNIASWRVKETDRISAMAIELRKVGARVEEGGDYLVVVPPPRLISQAGIDTYDDHRMAMCFSLVSLGGVAVRIHDPKCVNKTFPTYFTAFSAVATPVPVIAIDGPSASGKGTVAAQVADALGFHCLDSGSLYRLVALAALRADVALEDEAWLAAAASSLDVEFRGDRVLLGGEDVTAGIRTEDCSAGASRVATYPSVREALVRRQRDFRRPPGLVADGRDMGSVIFPDAEKKFFLTASVEARADRRYKQLIEKGLPANISDLSQELRLRDERDANRPVAPLRKMPEAILIDSSAMTVDEVVAEVLDRVRSPT